MRPATVLRASLAALALGLVATPPAAAFSADPARYEARPGNALTIEWDVPLAASNAIEPAGPGVCAALPSCVEVPLEIVPAANRGPTEDWLVILTLTWVTQRVQTPGAGGTNSADLDLRVYHQVPATNDDGSPQTDENGEPVMEWELTADSAFQTMPEVVKLYRPERRDYMVVAENFAGATSSLDIAVSFEDASYELGGPDAPAPRAAGPAPAPAPQETPSRPRLALGEQPGPRPTGPAAAPDGDFSFASQPFEPDLPTAGPASLSPARTETLAPASAATVLAATVPIPLAAIGTTAFVLARRRAGRPATRPSEAS